MTMPMPEDPGDIKPGDTQDPYPHGERCLNPVAHDIHEWSPEDKPHLKLICVGHNLCGETLNTSYTYGNETVQYDAVCSLDNGHEKETALHWDDVWGQFASVETIDTSGSDVI